MQRTKKPRENPEASIAVATITLPLVLLQQLLPPLGFLQPLLLVLFF
jgi:hypothetical protein